MSKYPTAYKLEIGDAKTGEFISISDHPSEESAKDRAKELISCFSKPANCYCYTIEPIYE